MTNLGLTPVSRQNDSLDFFRNSPLISLKFYREIANRGTGALLQKLGHHRAQPFEENKVDYLFSGFRARTCFRGCRFSGGGSPTQIGVFLM